MFEFYHHWKFESRTKIPTSAICNKLNFDDFVTIITTNHKQKNWRLWQPPRWTRQLLSQGFVLFSDNNCMRALFFSWYIAKVQCIGIPILLIWKFDLFQKVFQDQTQEVNTTKITHYPSPLAKFEIPSSYKLTMTCINIFVHNQIHKILF